jgi:hypothetical protein
MTWFNDVWLARMIAEERVAPRRRKSYRPPSRSGVEALRPLLRALMSWLF